MEKLKLGAQLYTVRDHMKTNDGFKRTIEKIAGIGYKYVQVSGIGDVSWNTVRESTENSGIKVYLTHTSPERILKETDKVIEDHAAVNCDGIGIGGMFGHERTEDGYKRFLDDFAPAMEKIKQSGKYFLYHNHRFEFEQYNGRTGMQILLDGSDKDVFKLTFDTYWAHAGGMDIIDFMKKYSGRIYTTHLKDMTVVSDKIQMTEIYTGNINFDGFLAASLENGIYYHFVEQDEVRMDAFDSMKISYDNLMKTDLFDR